MAQHHKADYDDLEDGDKSRLEIFRQMDRKSLEKIVPKWISPSSGLEAQLIDFNKQEIIMVDTEKLFQSVVWNDLNVDSLFNDDVGDFRYITTLERWQCGEPVDPPTIQFNGKHISIVDGRHRAVLNRYLRYTVTPIVVSKADRPIIQSILDIE